MITDLKINEENKKRYYEQGYWTEKTVNDIWNDRVAAHPDREYISDDMGVRLTYAEIDDKAARLASWLREQASRTVMWSPSRCRRGLNSLFSTLLA